jgi:hypothetical protein
MLRPFHCRLRAAVPGFEGLLPTAIQLFSQDQRDLSFVLERLGMVGHRYGLSVDSPLVCDSSSHLYLIGPHIDGGFMFHGPAGIDEAAVKFVDVFPAVAGSCATPALGLM